LPPFLLIRCRNSPTTRLRFRGDHLNEHAHAARAVAFKGRFFILFAFELARAAQDRALDVSPGMFAPLAPESQFAGADWSSDRPANARRDGNLADDSRENAATLRVGGAFLVFNGGPF